MSGRSKVFIAVLAGAAVAVPATLVLAGNGSSGPVDAQETLATGKQTAPKNWKVVPEVGGLRLDDGPHAVVASAQMKTGKAKFRVIQTGGGPAVAPGAVLFSSRAANSFSWYYPDGCALTPEDQYVLQWKRAGKDPAVAAKLSVLNLYESAGCA